MNIVPPALEEQIKRVDRQRSLAIGIGLGPLAAWSFFRLFWLIYVSMTFGWFMGAMAFHFVLWGVIGAVAAVGATGFLRRYLQASDT
ncbi:hypothetical protein A5725_24075 [Mycobacterium kubicae]|uniref:hypothetical protein n=1 Tax=Mycobacterium kubicae TaxID=120959 RepID=UPI0007FE140B|nr:hypothetical protein [Mycobacterium kubicae]OBF17443.1 hypothetical protein A5725_24075 [Mycobacterium kubicae]